jgi:hypothetical protein
MKPDLKCGDVRRATKYFGKENKEVKLEVAFIRYPVKKLDENKLYSTLPRLLSKSLEIKVYRTVILLFVLYGNETWTLTLRN